MSQSDYIKYKRVATVLRENEQPPVMEPHNYVDFKQFALVNTIVNTKPVTNQLSLSGEQIIFGIHKVVNKCPTFPLCKNTNTRINRVPMSSVYFTPVPQPLSVKDTKIKNISRTACACVLDSKNTNKNSCSCRTSRRWGVVR